MTIFKLGVLQNNLNLTKSSLGEGGPSGGATPANPAATQHLDTSVAQVNALLESLRSGLESNLN